MVNDPRTTDGSIALIKLLKTINTLALAAEPDFDAVCSELQQTLACDSVALRYEDGNDAYAASHPALPSSLLQSLYEALAAFAEPLIIIKDVARQRELKALLPQLQQHQINALALNRLHTSGGHDGGDNAGGDNATGDLLVCFQHGEALGEPCLQTIQVAAAQLALVLARRRSARRIQTLEGERALLDILQEIAARANRAQSFEDALRFAIDHICAFTKWPLGHAFWFEDRDGLEMVSYLTLPPVDAKESADGVPVPGELSLDAPIDRADRDSSSFGERFAGAEAEDIEETVESQAQREFLDRMFEKYLTERERKILYLYYGLDDGEERTLEEIGSLLGVTRERIRQIRNRAFEKLRESPDGEALSTFWSAN